MNSNYRFLLSTLALFICYFASPQYKYAKDISYRNGNDSLVSKYCKLDVAYPIGKKSPVTVIFFHGGGLTEGVKYFPKSFIEQNYIVVSPTYRRSPLSNAPSYIEDAALAVAWTFQNIEKFGGSPWKIVLTGYSAGAYLASIIYLDVNYLRKYNINPDSLLGFISFSGQMTTHFTILKERGITASSNSSIVDEYAPLNYIRSIKSKSYFFTGDRSLDMPGRYDQNTEIVSKLKKISNTAVEFIEMKGINHDQIADSASKASCQIINSIMLTGINRIPNNDVVAYVDEKLIKFKSNISDSISNLRLFDINGHELLNFDKKQNYSVSMCKPGAYIISYDLNGLNRKEKLIIF
jgi:hypothetical protein